MPVVSACLELRAQERVVSGQSVRSNAISVRLLRAVKADFLADAALMFFNSNISRKPMLRYETYTHRHCSVR